MRRLKVNPPLVVDGGANELNSESSGSGVSTGYGNAKWDEIFVKVASVFNSFGDLYLFRNNEIMMFEDKMSGRSTNSRAILEKDFNNTLWIFYQKMAKLRKKLLILRSDLFNEFSADDNDGGNFNDFMTYGSVKMDEYWKNTNKPNFFMLKFCQDQLSVYGLSFNDLHNGTNMAGLFASFIVLNDINHGLLFEYSGDGANVMRHFNTVVTNLKVFNPRAYADDNKLNLTGLPTYYRVDIGSLKQPSKTLEKSFGKYFGPGAGSDPDFTYQANLVNPDIDPFYRSKSAWLLDDTYTGYKTMPCESLFKLKELNVVGLVKDLFKIYHNYSVVVDQYNDLVCQSTPLQSIQYRHCGSMVTLTLHNMIKKYPSKKKSQRASSVARSIDSSNVGSTFSSLDYTAGKQFKLLSIFNLVSFGNVNVVKDLPLYANREEQPVNALSLNEIQDSGAVIIDAHIAETNRVYGILKRLLGAKDVRKEKTQHHQPTGDTWIKYWANTFNEGRSVKVFMNLKSSVLESPNIVLPFIKRGPSVVVVTLYDLREKNLRRPLAQVKFMLCFKYEGGNIVQILKSPSNVRGEWFLVFLDAITYTYTRSNDQEVIQKNSDLSPFMAGYPGLVNMISLCLTNEYKLRFVFDHLMFMEMAVDRGVGYLDGKSDYVRKHVMDYCQFDEYFLDEYPLNFAFNVLEETYDSSLARENNDWETDALMWQKLMWRKDLNLTFPMDDKYHRHLWLRLLNSEAVWRSNGIEHIKETKDNGVLDATMASIGEISIQNLCFEQLKKLYGEALNKVYSGERGNRTLGRGEQSILELLNPLAMFHHQQQNNDNPGGLRATMDAQKWRQLAFLFQTGGDMGGVLEKYPTHGSHGGLVPSEAYYSLSDSHLYRAAFVVLVNLLTIADTRSIYRSIENDPITYSSIDPGAHGMSWDASTPPGATAMAYTDYDMTRSTFHMVDRLTTPYSDRIYPAISEHEISTFGNSMTTATLHLKAGKDLVFNMFGTKDPELRDFIELWYPSKNQVNPLNSLSMKLPGESEERVYISNPGANSTYIKDLPKIQTFRWVQIWKERGFGDLLVPVIKKTGSVTTENMRFTPLTINAGEAVTTETDKSNNAKNVKSLQNRLKLIQRLPPSRYLNNHRRMGMFNRIVFPTYSIHKIDIARKYVVKRQGDTNGELFNIKIGRDDAAAADGGESRVKIMKVNEMLMNMDISTKLLGGFDVDVPMNTGERHFINALTNRDGMNDLLRDILGYNIEEPDDVASSGDTWIKKKPSELAYDLMDLSSDSKHLKSNWKLENLRLPGKGEKMNFSGIVQRNNWNFMNLVKHCTVYPTYLSLETGDTLTERVKEVTNKKMPFVDGVSVVDKPAWLIMDRHCSRYYSRNPSNVLENKATDVIVSGDPHVKTFITHTGEQVTYKAVQKRENLTYIKVGDEFQLLDETESTLSMPLSTKTADIHPMNSLDKETALMEIKYMALMAGYPSDCSYGSMYTAFRCFRGGVAPNKSLSINTLPLVDNSRTRFASGVDLVKTLMGEDGANRLVANTPENMSIILNSTSAYTDMLIKDNKVAKDQDQLVSPNYTPIDGLHGLLALYKLKILNSLNPYILSNKIDPKGFNYSFDDRVDRSETLSERITSLKKNRDMLILLYDLMERYGYHQTWCTFLGRFDYDMWEKKEWAEESTNKQYIPHEKREKYVPWKRFDYTEEYLDIWVRDCEITAPHDASKSFKNTKIRLPLYLDKANNYAYAVKTENIDKEVSQNLYHPTEDQNGAHVDTLENTRESTLSLGLNDNEVNLHDWNMPPGFNQVADNYGGLPVLPAAEVQQEDDDDDVSFEDVGEDVMPSQQSEPKTPISVQPMDQEDGGTSIRDEDSVELGDLGSPTSDGATSVEPRGGSGGRGGSEESYIEVEPYRLPSSATAVDPPYPNADSPKDTGSDVDEQSIEVPLEDRTPEYYLNKLGLTSSPREDLDRPIQILPRSDGPIANKLIKAILFENHVLAKSPKTLPVPPTSPSGVDDEMKNDILTSLNDTQIKRHDLVQYTDGVVLVDSGGVDLTQRDGKVSLLGIDVHVPLKERKDYGRKMEVFNELKLKRYANYNPVVRNESIVYPTLDPIGLPEFADFAFSMHWLLSGDQTTFLNLRPGLFQCLVRDTRKYSELYNAFHASIFNQLDGLNDGEIIKDYQQKAVEMKKKLKQSLGQLETITNHPESRYNTSLEQVFKRLRTYMGKVLLAKDVPSNFDIFKRRREPGVGYASGYVDSLKIVSDDFKTINVLNEVIDKRRVATNDGKRNMPTLSLSESWGGTVNMIGRQVGIFCPVRDVYDAFLMNYVACETALSEGSFVGNLYQPYDLAIEPKPRRRTYVGKDKKKLYKKAYDAWSDGIMKKMERILEWHKVQEVHVPELLTKGSTYKLTLEDYEKKLRGSKYEIKPSKLMPEGKTGWGLFLKQGEMVRKNEIISIYGGMVVTKVLFDWYVDKHKVEEGEVRRNYKSISLQVTAKAYPYSKKMNVDGMAPNVISNTFSGPRGKSNGATITLVIDAHEGVYPITGYDIAHLVNGVLPAEAYYEGSVFGEFAPAQNVEFRQDSSDPLAVYLIATEDLASETDAVELIVDYGSEYWLDQSFYKPRK